MTVGLRGESSGPVVLGQMTVTGSSSETWEGKTDATDAASISRGAARQGRLSQKGEQRELGREVVCPLHGSGIVLYWDQGIDYRVGAFAVGLAENPVVCRASYRRRISVFG